MAADRWVCFIAFVLVSVSRFQFWEFRTLIRSRRSADAFVRESPQSQVQTCFLLPLPSTRGVGRRPRERGDPNRLRPTRLLPMNRRICRQVLDSGDGVQDARAPTRAALGSWKIWATSPRLGQLVDAPHFLAPLIFWPASLWLRRPRPTRRRARSATGPCSQRRDDRHRE